MNRKTKNNLHKSKNIIEPLLHSMKYKEYPMT